jgi:hypothetical protein
MAHALEQTHFNSIKYLGCQDQQAIFLIVGFGGKEVKSPRPKWLIHHSSAIHLSCCPLTMADGTSSKTLCLRNLNVVIFAPKGRVSKNETFQFLPKRYSKGAHSPKVKQLK